MSEIILACLAALWLALCAVQDWRRRQVGNALTLPVLAAAILLRLTGVVQGSIFLLLLATIGLLFCWRKGWIGGADLKACLALALLDIQMLVWAWAGLALWYLSLRLIFRGEDVHSLPGFVGFAAGTFLYLLGTLNGS
jgi:Flp pilus assembly protein protease CpaA